MGQEVSIGLTAARSFTSETCCIAAALDRDSAIASVRSDDPTAVNTGVLLVRNGACARRLLHAAHARRHEADRFARTWEQAVLRLVRQASPHEFCVAPPRVLQSFTWAGAVANDCLLYTSPSPRDRTRSRMPSSA